uniref:hypothetical protein n=1 Tax=Enterocloster clostridioformis TaxID=1531 RepID=UPI0026F1D9A4
NQEEKPIFKALRIQALSMSVLYDTAADSLAYPGRRLSPTMASADFSQFVVTTANGTACET